jgi:flagellar biosynthetic protein FlhB
LAEQDDRERTEEATPHRRKEARERGQVALSQDLVAALSLCAAAGIVAFLGVSLARGAGALVRSSVATIGAAGKTDLDAVGWSRFVADSARPIAFDLALVVGALLAVGIAAGYAQVGFQIAPKAIELDFERLSPAKGWKKLTGSKSAARTVQAALKILIVGGVGAATSWSSVPALARLTGAPLGIALSGVGRVLAHVLGYSIGAFLSLAVLDALYQRWQHQRDLRMTRDELKQELKTTDGDPHVRARIREIQRRMARQRMMADVPTASVVVTNPTHIAVALRWQPEEAEASGDSDRSPPKRGVSKQNARAPVVVAKGADLMAERIKDVAREHGVPLCEDVPLARALHARCEIGQEIATDLYEAVAAVLAQVWKLAPPSARSAESPNGGRSAELSAARSAEVSSGAPSARGTPDPERRGTTS